MKILLRPLIAVICFSLLPGLVSGQGIEFFHGSWEEALIEAEKQNKAIFVDCYTTWCGPCKRMARDVFPDPSVGDFYNKHFINVKMDMEKGEGPSFARKYPVGAYPTLYFIKPDGEVITAQKGARPVKEFIALGESVLKKFDVSADFEKAYEEGDRDPALILDYVKALNQSNRSSLKVVNDFLRDGPSMDDSLTRAIVFEGATEADSRPFNLLIEHKADYEREYGSDPVRFQIVAACERTAAKALEFEYYALVEQAVELMKKHAPREYEEFQYTAPLSYYQGMSDWQSYLPLAKEYVKKELKKDSDRLITLARSVKDYFGHEPEALAFSGELLQDAARYGDSWNCDYELAVHLYQQRDYSEARKVAREALEKAKKEGAATQSIEALLMNIQAQLKTGGK